jgi:putative Mg2+ transporter-C (MgtC) family protein
MTILDAILRLGAAIIAGGAIGLNRDLRNKPAGVRTHALVALGSALATILVAEDSDPNAMSRVIQGIITGIGFLGAGVILRREGGRTVRGLTTAASIWVVAALGIACGMGQWVPVAVGTVLTLAVLILGGPLEDSVHRLRGGTGPPKGPGGDGSSGGGGTGSS